MRQIIDPPWPPTLDALTPPPATEGFPRDPEAALLIQHRDLTRILIDLADVADRLESESHDGVMLRRRMAVAMGRVNPLIESHRDFEESVLFPRLLVLRPETAPSLDDLSDQHLLIFKENRELNDLLDQLDLEPTLSNADREELHRRLRSFLTRLWGHTLAEEALMRGGESPP